MKLWSPNKFSWHILQLILWNEILDCGPQFSQLGGSGGVQKSKFPRMYWNTFWFRNFWDLVKISHFGNCPPARQQINKRHWRYAEKISNSGQLKRREKYLPMCNKWLTRALWQISILVNRLLITDHWSFGPLLDIPEQELPKQLVAIERWCLLELRASILQRRYKKLPVLNNVSYGSAVSREENGRILTSSSSPGHPQVNANRKITVTN